MSALVNLSNLAWWKQPLAPAGQNLYTYMVNCSSYNRRRPASALSGLLLLAAALVGCRRDNISVYRVAKEDPPVQKALPAGWQELPPDQMRVGNYAIEGANGAKAQLTIIPLPGAAGTELDNVNRWQNQLGSEPVTADQRQKLATQIQLAGSPARLFDLSGTDPNTKAPTRILAAIQLHGDSQWFFKMMG